MSFFDNLFGNGSSSANKYAGAAKNELLAAGTNANTRLNPYAQQGLAASDHYGALLGLQGQQVAQNHYGNFQADPFTQAMGVGGTYQASPGYQWQLGQGLNAVDSSAASKGLLGSGATLKAEEEYGQGLANQDYQQWLGNLSSTYDNYLGNLAGQANTGVNTATQQGNNQLTSAGAGALQTAQIGANKTAGANGLAGLIPAAAVGTGRQGDTSEFEALNGSFLQRGRRTRRQPRRPDFVRPGRCGAEREGARSRHQ
jgi:hypothetical protein